MKIFKYPLPARCGHIPMPRGWKPLHVAVQREHPCLWAEVNPDSEMGIIEIVPVMTGEDVPGGYSYLGTALMEGGYYVVHYYASPWARNTP